MTESREDIRAPKRETDLRKPEACVTLITIKPKANPEISLRAARGSCFVRGPAQLCHSLHWRALAALADAL